MKRIVFTGGGSAGHVTPNIALFPKLRSMGYDIHYIGSYEGIEKKLRIIGSRTMAFQRANSEDILISKISAIPSACSRVLWRRGKY